MHKPLHENKSTSEGSRGDDFFLILDGFVPKNLNVDKWNSQYYIRQLANSSSLSWRNIRWDCQPFLDAYWPKYSCTTW